MIKLFAGHFFEGFHLTFLKHDKKALEVLVEITNQRLSTELNFSAKKSGNFFITPPILVLEAKFEYSCNPCEISD